MFIQLAEGVEEGAPPGRGDYSRWTADAIKDDDWPPRFRRSRSARIAMRSRVARRSSTPFDGVIRTLHSDAAGAWVQPGAAGAGAKVLRAKVRARTLSYSAEHH